MKYQSWQIICLKNKFENIHVSFYNDAVFNALLPDVLSCRWGMGGNRQWVPSGEFGTTLRYPQPYPSWFLIFSCLKHKHMFMLTLRFALLTPRVFIFLLSEQCFPNPSYFNITFKVFTLSLVTYFFFFKICSNSHPSIVLAQAVIFTKS